MNALGRKLVEMRLIEPERSLAETHPHLVAEWDPENEKKPDEITAGSGLHVGWVCSLGHRWPAVIGSRATQKTGCPFCSGRRALPETCLAITHPNLVAEWDPENVMSLLMISKGSHLTVKWVCSKGHRWRAKVYSRASGACCPHCTRNAVTEQTCLMVTHPQLAAEWAPGNEKTPFQVGSWSVFKAGWVCSRGHRWKATVSRRAESGGACPYCTGNLAVTHPHLISEWDPDNEKTPLGTKAGSDFKAKWICPKGHRFSTQVKKRALRGYGCPTCWNLRRQGRAKKTVATGCLALWVDNGLSTCVERDLK